MSGEPVRDDEVLMRRIPPGHNWFEPPDRITSANFKLRPKERGLSVYREDVLNECDLLSRPDAIGGSFVVRAAAGAIRTLCDINGLPLNLDVITVDDEEDPGHAEIRGPTPEKLSRAAVQALRDLFSRSFRPFPQP